MDIPTHYLMAWLLAFPLVAFDSKTCEMARSEIRIVDVLIGNYASISAPFLSEAQAEAERILEPGGVRIAWRRLGLRNDEQSTSQPSRLENFLTIKLLSAEMEARLRPPENEIGLALGSTAYIFCARLSQIREKGFVFSWGRVLGNVLAHEIAHLLLGPGAHAQAGLMKARWRIRDLTYADQGTLTLLRSQVERLRCAAPRTDRR